MKKELFAAIFLILILISCVINIWYVNELTAQLTALVNASEDYALSEAWDKAALEADRAAKLMKSNNIYLNIVLPHERIDSTLEALFELQALVDSRDTEGIPGAARLTVSKIEKLSALEKVSIESIF